MLAFQAVRENSGKQLLKGVSRSFYLTLRLLPGPMRGAASLGYLLARTSDTLADTAAAPVDARLLVSRLVRPRPDRRGASSRVGRFRC